MRKQADLFEAQEKSRGVMASIKSWKGRYCKSERALKYLQKLQNAKEGRGKGGGSTDINIYEESNLGELKRKREEYVSLGELVENMSLDAITVVKPSNLGANGLKPFKAFHCIWTKKHIFYEILAAILKNSRLRQFFYLGSSNN